MRYSPWVLILVISQTLQAQSLSLAAFDSLRTVRKATKVIDLRHAPAHDRGHIRFAQVLPYQDPNFKDVFLQRFPRHIPVVLYCQTGSLSQEAQTYLSGLGYRDVYYIAGGFDAWTTASRPYVSKFPTSEPIAPLTFPQLAQTTAPFAQMAVIVGGDPCVECAQQADLFRQALPHIPVLLHAGFRVAGLREQLAAPEGPILLIFQHGKQVWRLDGPWQPADLAPLLPVFRP